MLTTKRRLDKCKQFLHEDTKDYIDRFRILTLRCAKGAIVPEDIMNKFIRGLHPILQDQVTISCPQTYEEAVTKALYFTKQLSLWGNTRHAMRLVDEENYESHDQYPTINYLSHPARPRGKLWPAQEGRNQHRSYGPLRCIVIIMITSVDCKIHMRTDTTDHT